MAKEFGEAVKGMANVGLGSIELLAANNLEAPLIDGTVSGLAKTFVDAIFHGGSQAVDDLGATLKAFPVTLESGPDGIIGGIAIAAMALNGGLRLIRGGASIKEGFGK